MDYYFQYTDNEIKGVSASCSLSLTGDAAEYLPSILNGFLRFLNASGFTYIDMEIEEVSGGFMIRKSL